MAQMNFAVSLKLIKDGFDKGAQDVRTGLRNIQFQALAMAQALGLATTSLSGLISKMIETARETNKARTTLQNVSDTTARYSRSLSFLKGLSQEYGIELNSTTDAFAKFSAAASASGMAIETQYKVFEALSRSVAAFGMSSQEASLTFYAVQQMMSKGKISAEELRRQLGERLPIALQAMANAAGVPVSKMDEMLRRGELISSEIIPKFASALTDMTPKVNTDNLESSLNRLQNAFTDFVEDSGIGEAFKKMVDLLTSFLSDFKLSWTGVLKYLAPLIGIKLVGLMENFRQKGLALAQAQTEDFKRQEERKTAILAEQEALRAKITKSQGRISDAKGRIDEARLSQSRTDDGAMTDKINKAEIDAVKKLEATKTAIHNSAEAERTRATEAQARLREKIAKDQRAVDKWQRKVDNAPNDIKDSEDREAKAIAREQAKIDELHGNAVRKRQEYEAKITAIKEKGVAERLRIENREAEARNKLLYHKSALEDRRDLYAIKQQTLDQSLRKEQEAINQAERNAHKRLEDEKLRITRTNEKLRTEALRKESIARQEIQAEEANIKKYQSALDKTTQAGNAVNEQLKIQKAAESASAGAQTAWAKANTSISLGIQRLATGAKTIWAGMVFSMKMMWASLQAMVMSTAIGLVIGAVIGLVMNLIESIKEANQYTADLASTAERLQEKANKDISEDSQIETMNKLIRLMEDENALKVEKESAHRKIQELMGEEIKDSDKLIARAKEFVSVLKSYKLKGIFSDQAEEAKKVMEAFERKINLSRAQLKELTPSMEEYFGSSGYNSLMAEAGLKGDLTGVTNIPSDTPFGPNPVFYDLLSQIIGEEGQNYTKAVRENAEALDKAKKAAETFAIGLNYRGFKPEQIDKSLAPPPPTTDKGTNKDEDKSKHTTAQKTRWQRAEEDFAHNKLALERRLKAGDIEEKEFSQEMRNVAKNLKRTLIEELGEKASHRGSFSQAVAIEKKYPEIDKERERYLEALEANAKQLANGAISQEEADRRRLDEERKRYEALASLTKLTDEQAKELTELKSRDFALESAKLDLAKDTRLLALSYKNGAKTEQEYLEAQTELELSTALSILSRQRVTEAEAEYANNLRKIASERVGRLMELKFGEEAKKNEPKDIYKDPDLAYRKDFETPQDKRKELEEDYQKAQEELKFLQEQARKTGQTLNQEISGAMKKVQGTAQKLKLSIISEDIDKAMGDMMKNTKGVHSGLNSLRSAFKELGDSFDPESKRDDWERFFGVFSGIISVIEGISSLIKAIEGISTAIALVKTATVAKQAVDTAVSSTQIAQEAGKVGVYTASTVAATALTIANKKLAASNIFVAHSAIPFAGVPIAASYVATMEAVMAGVTAFERGGIVGGNSYSGDRVLARVNSGEMILNAQQQGRLFRMANGLNRPDPNEYSNKVDVVLSGEAIVRGDSLRIALARAIRKHDR